MVGTLPNGLWNTSAPDRTPAPAFLRARQRSPHTTSEQARHRRLNALHNDHDHHHHHDHADCDHDHGPKHIYIYSPSSAVRDKAAFKRGIARLKALGHEVEVDVDALASHTRFAGDDATRLAAIHRAAASGAHVALISRGGYGLSRILPGIRYKAVAKAIDKGMKFVGLSDFTAFQNALLAQTGAVSWAGPALGADFGVAGEPDDIMEACFDDLLTGHGEGTGWRMHREKPDATTGKPAVPDIYVKSAQLWGGNLAVLASLVGTPYLPSVKGGILFLEDVNEHPYRIERLLTQLLHAGVLAQQKAVVLGQFNQFKLVPHDKGYKLQSVVDWLRTQIKAPVLTNLPFGHVETKVLLPVGATVSLSVEERDALIYWGHIG
ncbi:putative MccF-like protein (microcin C7 resistance) [Acidovorax sp. CF316]|uniref:LD-carboxypeptidase n=1 Tax=Acidovorax sp. CF316 TaxID=1144317 RepID=UPI00026BCBC4|nr:putative MccF-like protein (microcin C7 resistance) [Acidovorax sp. CF316]